jgi:hypothetical protein
LIGDVLHRHGVDALHNFWIALLKQLMKRCLDESVVGTSSAIDRSGRGGDPLDGERDAGVDEQVPDRAAAFGDLDDRLQACRRFNRAHTRLDLDGLEVTLTGYCTSPPRS